MNIVEVLNELMANFLQEACNKHGSDYIPSTLLAAVQQHLNKNSRPEVRFFDEKDPTFSLLRQSLDARMKELTAAGLGCSKKSITPEMEDKLWRKEIWTRETGRGLINPVYWYACKMFGLRAADEHRGLRGSS